MTIKDGPLTERQLRIMEGLMAGLSHKQIAMRTGISLSTIGQENTTLLKKFNARKVSQALAVYATAQAYHNAAAQLLSGRIPVPVDEVEEHVNHVLEGLAALLQDWSDQRMPK